MRNRYSIRSVAVVWGFSLFGLAWSGCACGADGHEKKGRDERQAPLVTAPIMAPVAIAQPTQDPAPDTVRSSIRPNGSLWSSRSRDMFSDIRARVVGDTVTIIVQETASASSSATTKSSKDDSASFGGGSGLLKGLLKDFGASAKMSSSGDGSTNRSGSLVTRLSAVVKEVLPNGNLVLEGLRTVTVNKEIQKVVITGIVRPQDVNPDNTVSSVQIANATIQYDGKGPVGDRQRRGLISTIFGWLF